MSYAKIDASGSTSMTQRIDNEKENRRQPVRAAQIPNDAQSSVRYNTPEKQATMKQTFVSKIYPPPKGGAKGEVRSGHRIFRLKGYTTVGKINRKFQQERNQRTLRNALTFLMIIIFLIILVAIYNPFTNVDELKKITGEDSFYQKNNQEETNYAITP